MEPQLENKAWVVAVDMGYGHQRSAYPLRGLAPSGSIINANNYPGIPRHDHNFWRRNRSSYEFISRFRRVPIIGLAIFFLFDSFQRILRYYPKRDLSKPSDGSRIIYHFVRRGWGADLVEKLGKHPLPLVTSFFIPAFMAEQHRYPGDIYCIICDADIARGWVAEDPKRSRIIYFAPNDWGRDRLKLYGVPEERILLTGYPLPKENIGGAGMETLKKDLSYRLVNLDRKKKYRTLYAPLVKAHLGKLPELPNHPLTLLFSIGGAGAQKEIAAQIITSLQPLIGAREVRFIMSVGIREYLGEYFKQRFPDLMQTGWLQILSGGSLPEYFDRFNRALRTTDILMTKPSELSFYAGLGIPVIIEPSIGSQEDFNGRWLTHVGAGMKQENPRYTNEWLPDLLDSGDLAEMAMQGFVEIEKMGTYHIERIVAERRKQELASVSGTFVQGTGSPLASKP